MERSERLTFVLTIPRRRWWQARIRKHNPRSQIAAAGKAAGLLMEKGRAAERGDADTVRRINSILKLDPSTAVAGMRRIGDAADRELGA